MTLDNIKDFIKEYIIIIPDFVYTKIDKNFQLNTGLMSNNKLVIQTEDIVKRLIYVLRITFLRNRQKILDYYKKLTIDDYYSDITDFETYNFQVILEGSDSLSKWISELQTNYTLYSQIQFEYTFPYFFKNSLINNEIYLTQNFDSLEKALNVSKLWVKSNIINPSYTLYSYSNSTDIITHNIIGQMNNYNFKVIVSKYNEKLLFTVLLSI